ncbi:MAG: c-type cytochrome [Gammaproteobacteria bacterium]|nr:c-type cytochrome [Gammaproteobacteria bacterium]
MIARVAALSGVIGFSASLVWAQTDSARIANNIAPIGEVCLAGEPCTEAPGVNAVSQPAASTPAPMPTAVAEPAPAAAAAPAADDFDVAGTYQLRCFACHGTGAAGAPVLGDADAWGERMAKGMETVMANAINGIGAMPARGLCMDCTDDHISALIDYMVEGGQ